ncbi:MAG TPA: flippase [Chloroflexota bacterium]|nr:flippase [Chloroflexota bacterium]
MTEDATHVRFRRGLLFTSSGAIVNLFLLAVETVVAARVLPVAIYGAYILLTTTVQFLMIVADLGCKLSVIQFLSRGEESRSRAVVATALGFRVATLAVLSGVVWLFHDLLRFVDPSPDLAFYVGFIPIMLVTSSLDELLSAMLQGFHRYRPMALAQITRGVLRVVLTSGLLIILHAGIVGLVASWSISFAVAVAYQYWSLPRRGLTNLSLTTLREILSFGASLQATSFLSFAASRLHVTLLGALAGVDSVAFFAAASRIPDALSTLKDSYFRVYFPSMTTLLAQKRHQTAQVLFDRSMRLISFGGALAAVTGTVFSRQIIEVIYSAKYESAAPAFAVLMVSLQMTIQVSVLGYTLTAAGHPGKSLAVTLVRTVASALGDLLLIPPLGFLGSAWAAVGGSYASLPSGVWLLRSSATRAEVAPCLKQTALLIVFAAVGWWIQPEGIVESGVLKVAIVAAFVVTSVRLATITSDDLSLVVGGRLSRLALRVGFAGAPVAQLEQIEG